MDKRTVALVALLATVVAVVGLKLGTSEPPQTFSEGLDNWTEIFHGYEAYLDNRIFPSTVSGTSMEPTFGDGDVILWVEVDPAELRVGDIIIYDHPTKPGEGPIAHRIIEITKDGEYRFETKGDNLPESDAETAISAYFVSEGDLKGLVIGVLYRKPPA